MLKDLAIETAVLAGLFFFVFMLVPNARLNFNSRVVPLLFLGFLGFMGLAVFQVKRLWNGGKTKHAVAFTVILIIIIVISSVVRWILSEPEPIDWLG